MSGRSELFRCSGCRCEKEILYDEKDLPVAETRCMCKDANQNKPKNLDKILSELVISQTTRSKK
jgi:hypothetical protein